MNWSFKIARASGIDIRVHVTFLLIVLWGASQFSRYGITGMLFGVALILLLFLCVTLHELGHSVVAQKFGVGVRQIVLLPIGGVAMMQRIPRNPWQELWIALAGPVVNVVIAGAIALGLFLRSQLTGVTFRELLTLGGEGPSIGLMFRWLLSANIALVVFNMIPAFPLDGGRVFRALLAMKLPYARATAVASGVGQVLALLLGTYGLMTHQLLLALVAVFIFLGAGAENVEGRARAVLSGHRVGEAYNKRAVTLAPGEPLRTVIDHLLTSYQPDFAVIDGRDKLLGVVTRGDVIRALSQGTGDVSVGQVMNPPALRVSADQTLEQVREALGEAGQRLAAVYDGDHFLGLVSREDIDEAYAVLQFTDGSSTSRAPEGGVVV
jgi:Zn-dependent protease/CBS domain-containing protein